MAKPVNNKSERGETAEAKMNCDFAFWLIFMVISFPLICIVFVVLYRLRLDSWIHNESLRSFPTWIIPLVPAYWITRVVSERMGLLKREIVQIYPEISAGHELEDSQQEVFQVKLSKANRYGVIITLVGLSFMCWLAFFDILNIDKFTAFFGVVLLTPVAGLYSRYIWIDNLLKVDLCGISDQSSLYERFIKWDQVSTCSVETTRNSFGEVVNTVLLIKRQYSKKFIKLNISYLSAPDRTKLIKIIKSNLY